jgi:hypothetical protein
MALYLPLLLYSLEAMDSLSSFYGRVFALEMVHVVQRLFL